MQMLLGLVEAGPAGQHQIGPLQELRLPLAQLRWRPGKRGQLVHAVVHDGEGREAVQQGQGHRCVEPDDVLLDRLPGKKVRDHRPEEGELVIGEAGRRQGGVRPDDRDARIVCTDLEPGGAVVLDRLLDE